MVYIVVLNWNRGNDTIECLESLVRLERAAFKIVVVDNASSDDSVAEILNWREEYKDRLNYLKGADFAVIGTDEILTRSTVFGKRGFYLIKSEINAGYSAGNNFGIKFSAKEEDFEFVWLLNNDTVVDVFALEEMIKRMSRKKAAGICGSRMVYYVDRSLLQGLGGKYNPTIGVTKHLFDGHDAMKELDEQYVESNIDYPIGASLLISKQTIDSVGLLSEEFFLYFEELDYTHRVKSAGLKIAIATKSIVYHKEGKSTEKGKCLLADYLSNKNKMVITKKYYRNLYYVIWCTLFYIAMKHLVKLEFKKFINTVSVIFGRRKNEPAVN